MPGGRQKRTAGHKGRQAGRALEMQAGHDWKHVGAMAVAADRHNQHNQVLWCGCQLSGRSELCKVKGREGGVPVGRVRGRTCDQGGAQHVRVQE